MMKERLRSIVLEKGARAIPFERTDIQAAQDEEERRQIWTRQRPPQVLEVLKQELAADPTPHGRYEVEFRYDLYGSYKPGLDGEGDLFDLAGELDLVIEIGCGPARLSGESGARDSYGIDIAEHPRARARLGALRISDFLGEAVEACILSHQCRTHQAWARTQGDRMPLPRLEVPDPTIRTLVALSYCLDRIPDQQAAIASFARILHGGQFRQNTGLITICLPAEPKSPGVSGISYGGNWVTKGEDPIEDFALLVEECEDNQLRLTAGGLTTHYGVSLDGYEELPCYVLVLEPV